MINDPTSRSRSRLTLAASLFLSAILLSGCAKVWKMMPTPIAFEAVGESAYAHIPEAERSSEIQVFYATNRPAVGLEEARHYLNGTADRVALGVATMRFGGEWMDWKALLKVSTHGQRPDKISVFTKKWEELGELTPSDPLQSPGGAAAFAAAVNAKIAKSRHKDITIYVHGARANMHRCGAQAAQFHHFMARDGAFILYAWPTTQNFLTYDQDVKNAAKTVPHFARLVEFLSINTNARYINILAYSAGSQVASPGLHNLRNSHPEESTASLRKRLRLGEVYFAAPDVGLREFVLEYLPAFQDLVLNVTSTFHIDDGVLSFAQFSHKVARAGRPDGSELNEEELEWIGKVAARPSLDFIDMAYTDGPRDPDFSNHGYWYTNPWVSSDVVLKFLSHKGPAERGLLLKEGGPVWFFPHDYPERMNKAFKRARTNRE